MSCRFSRKAVMLGALLLMVDGAAIAQDNNVNVTIRHAPYDVPNVSSKSEIAHRSCDFCGSSVSYERKYRWDTVRHEWIETTDASTVPTSCRKCRREEKDSEKLEREEKELDRRIEVEKTKSRISSKKNKLQRLRNANR